MTEQDRLLGRMEEHMAVTKECLSNIVKKLEKIDHRLVTLEVKASIYGGLSGGIIGIIASLFIKFL